jgi:hypothetical protein
MIPPEIFKSGKKIDLDPLPQESTMEMAGSSDLQIFGANRIPRVSASST